MIRWTPEQEKMLRDLWGKMPARKIAFEINRATKSTVTTNAVIGKANRMDLQFIDRRHTARYQSQTVIERHRS